MTFPPYRLAAITSHPVQYQSPLFRHLAANGIDLTVFYGHDGSLVGEIDQEFAIPVKWDRPLLEGYVAVFLQRRSRALNAVQRLRADAKIILHLWRGRFDAVFIHSYATRLSLLAYAGAIASGTPVLLRSESERFCSRRRPLALLKQIILRPLFALTSAFLVIGRANRDFYNAYGVRPSRQFFTPYSVDNEYFTAERARFAPRRRELREQHGWGDEVVVIGFSGKLIPRKRVEDLLDAAAVLQREGLPVALLVIGEGPLRPALERRAQALGLTRITFAGFKNQSELAPLYVCMDVFVLPSTYDTWGLVVNEAMVFGLPVVTSSKVGAALDLVEAGRNGHTFEAGDVRGLVDALRRLAVSRETRQSLGRRSREIVRRYSYETCLAGILEALRRVARRTSAPVVASSSSNR